MRGAGLRGLLRAASRTLQYDAGFAPDESHAWTKAYFVGVPTPAGAGLALLPMILSFEFPEVFNIDFNLHLNLPPRVLACWLLFVGALMVSRLPTFSMKGIRVPVSYLVPLFVAVGLLGAGLATNTWFTLGLVGLAYIGPSADFLVDLPPTREVRARGIGSPRQFYLPVVRAA